MSLNDFLEFREAFALFKQRSSMNYSRTYFYCVALRYQFAVKVGNKWIFDKKKLNDYLDGKLAPVFTGATALSIKEKLELEDFLIKNESVLFSEAIKIFNISRFKLTKMIENESINYLVYDMKGKNKFVLKITELLKVTNNNNKKVLNV